MKIMKKSEFRLVDVLLNTLRSIRLAKKGRKIVRSVKKNKKEYGILLAAISTLPKRYKRR